MSNYIKKLNAVLDVTVMDALLGFARYALRDHDRAHDYDHAIDVCVNALEIVTAERMQLTDDEQVLLPYVMIGHDFRDYKMKNTLSAEEIAAFYTQETGHRIPDAAAVLESIHSNCSWSKRKTSAVTKFNRLRLILQDADWIEGMSIKRAIDYSYAAFPGITDIEVCKRVREHIVEKLALIPVELNFDSSRKIVAARGLDQELARYMAATASIPAADALKYTRLYSGSAVVGTVNSGPSN